MRLVILGPPGAGKGTQAARLAAHLAIPAVSTGDIFRSNIAEGTPLGVQVKEILDSGGYVSDDITNAMVRDRLAQDDAAARLPARRLPAHARPGGELDAMLAEGGHALDRVVELTVDREEIVQRLIKRAETEGRSDDTEDVIRRRQQIYADETAPLVEVYRERGLLVAVDGLGEVDEVTQRLVAALDQALSR